MNKQAILCLSRPSCLLMFMTAGPIKAVSLVYIACQDPTYIKFMVQLWNYLTLDTN